MFIYQCSVRLRVVKESDNGWWNVKMKRVALLINATTRKDRQVKKPVTKLHVLIGDLILGKRFVFYFHLHIQSEISSKIRILRSMGNGHFKVPCID